MGKHFQASLTASIIFFAGACSSDQHSAWQFNEDVGTDSPRIESDDVLIGPGQTSAISAHDTQFDFVEIRSRVGRGECLHVLLSNSNPREMSSVTVNDGYDVSTVYLGSNECLFDEPVRKDEFPLEGSIAARSYVGEVFIAETDGYLDVRLSIVLENGEELELEEERVLFVTPSYE